MYWPTSAAFLCVLMRCWGYMYDRGLIYDLFEVPMCLALMEGASGSSSLTRLGGAKGQSQKVVQIRRYSRKEGNFKYKSTIGACLRITNWITWKVWLVGRDMDLVKIVAKKYMLVRRFQSISSRIKISENNKCLQAIREIKELRTLGPYTSRSVYGGLLSAKFSKFFYEANWNMIFWEIYCWGI